MIATLPLLFLWGLFSSGDTEPKNDKDVVPVYDMELLKKTAKTLTLEQALEILLENGFLPQLPSAPLLVSNLKVQKQPDAAYERINVMQAKKPVILHFWATWCGPCKRELPEFSTFVQAVQKDITVYLITGEVSNGGNDAAKAIWDFYQAQSLKGLNVTCDENSRLAAFLGVRGIPVTFLVNSQGQVIGQFLGAVNWHNATLAAAILTVLR